MDNSAFRELLYGRAQPAPRAAKAGIDMRLVEHERARIRAAAQPQTTDADLEAALTDAQRAPPPPPEAPEPRFQRAQMQHMTPDVIYVNGKRLRKKRRPESAPSSAPSSTPSSTRPDPPKPTAPLPSFVPHVEDADEDIFGDAPEWTGVEREEGEGPSEGSPDGPSDRQPDEQSGKQSERPPDEQPDERPEEQPDGPDAPPDTPPNEPFSRSPSPPPPTRLEGLSSSALPSDVSRWLLAREEELSARDATRSRDPPRKRRRSNKGRGEPESP